MFTFFISYLKVCTLIVSMMLSVVSLSVNVCSKTCYIWFIYTLGSCYIFVFSICSVCINIYYVFCCNGK